MHEDLADALRQTTATLIGRPLDESERVGVAVSGGPDSMALLAIAADAWPGQVVAATVDHGLRSASAAEAALVARWCVEAGVPHDILAPGTPIDGSVQAAARAARYALLEDWRQRRGVAWLMTAHHADDQRETMLMRLNRGSGIAGLSGIRARRGPVLRPFLDRRGAELKDHARRAGLPVVDDPSNADPRFDRARLRTALDDADWLDPVRVTRSAAALADAEAALAWSVAALIAAHVERDGDGCRLVRIDLPREYLRRILAHMVAATAPDAPPPRGGAIGEALVQLCDGKRVSIGGCVASGDGSGWTVRRAPPRRTG